jgi:cyclic dehypoxanthinyl futalosine synthase
MGISRKQALDCFRSDDLVGIGMEADAVRRRLHPEGVVSYVIERRIDLAALAGRSDTETLEGVCGAIGESVEMGATGVHLVGLGVDGEGILALLRSIRRRYPAVWIEGLTAADIGSIAGGWEIGLRDTLARLWDAGLDTIAGDGADLREGVEAWSAVHRAAHQAGMRTEAEMVFGAGKTAEQQVEFLEAVRGLEEETGGFGAFVPVAADAPGGRELDGVTAVERLKTLAVARMFLDNVENVQAIGAGNGLKVLQMGLRFGANDVGPVRAQIGSEEDVRRVIRDAGFRPAERDMAYRAMMLS